MPSPPLNSSGWGVGVSFTAPSTDHFVCVRRIGAPARQSELGRQRREQQPVQPSILPHSMLKGEPSLRRTLWPGNTENVQTFPPAGFILVVTSIFIQKVYCFSSILSSSGAPPWWSDLHQQNTIECRKVA